MQGRFRLASGVIDGEKFFGGQTTISKINDAEGQRFFFQQIQHDFVQLDSVFAKDQAAQRIVNRFDGGLDLCDAIGLRFGDANNP